MPRAVWNGITVAQSDDTVVVEGNHYFPRESVREDLLRESALRTWCPWKGIASYYSLRQGNVFSRNAVWFYADPMRRAEKVRGRVAFRKDVHVEG